MKTTLLLALVVGAIFGAAINHSTAVTAAQEVYGACMQAHYETNGASE